MVNPEAPPRKHPLKGLDFAQVLDCEADDFYWHSRLGIYDPVFIDPDILHYISFEEASYLGYFENEVSIFAEAIQDRNMYHKEAVAYKKGYLLRLEGWDLLKDFWLRWDCFVPRSPIGLSQKKEAAILSRLVKYKLIKMQEDDFGGLYYCLTRRRSHVAILKRATKNGLLLAKKK